MATSIYDESRLQSLGHLLGYFDQQVLAAYRNEPHRYIIGSCNFEGKLGVTDEYYRELESQGKTAEYVSIRFGYRTRRDGNLAIVAWLPDLLETSKTHIARWSAFHLADPEWMTDYDERFGNWVQRYLEGSWEVDSGSLHHLGRTIKVINGLTMELVDIALYKHEIDETLGYPAAENTRRYQNAHERLYGYLVDGLDRQCISRLASKLRKTISVGDKKTIEAITKLFPDLETSPNFMSAVKLVSEQRRLASHGVRPAAQSFPAFSQFTTDLSLCLEATKEVLVMLEREFGVNGDAAFDRHEAKKMLPLIGRPPDPYYSIAQASKMVGKTVEKVDFGFRENIAGAHESEALIVYFTDGSIMSIETGSNLGNLATDDNGMRPQDFHVDFLVHWVPKLPEGM